MDKAYWDAIGRRYDGEIFDVNASDGQGRIAEAVARLAGKDAPAYDLGCGTGKFFPLLLPHCGSIHAIDLSSELLKQARRRFKDCEGLRFSCMDLADPEPGLEPAPFLFSVNMLIMPSVKLREKIWHSLAALAEPGAALLLVVPSLESVLYSDYRISEWNRREGLSPGKAQVFSPSPKGGGLVELDGVPTKHYLREELELLLPANGFNFRELHKIEYSWSTEVPDPPDWMQAPYPWDWMCVGRRMGG